MDALFIILIGVVITLIAALCRPTPQPQIIYVQVEPRRQAIGPGCLPMVMIGTIILAISHRTAENHMQHIREKIGVPSRAAVVTYAWQQGILPLH